MYFHPKLSWPPGTYDVIHRNHSSWPSINLFQNLRKGWTKSYWKYQVVMSYPLRKKSEKPYGGVGVAVTPNPFLVRPTVNIFWYKVFCPLKIKITQFPDGIRLKLFLYLGFFFLQIFKFMSRLCSKYESAVVG